VTGRGGDAIVRELTLDTCEGERARADLVAMLFHVVEGVLVGVDQHEAMSVKLERRADVEVASVVVVQAVV